MASKSYNRDLEVFIVLANLLPDDCFQSGEPGAAQPVDLPALYEGVLAVFPGPVDPPTSGSSQAFRIAQRIPQVTVGGTTLLLGDRAVDDADRLAQVHDLLVAVRGVLGRLTLTIGRYPHGEYRSPKEAGRASGSATLVVQTKEHRQIVVDNGCIRVEPSVLDAFFGALDGAPLDRLRRCPQCGALFLAKRQDKGGCSPMCCNALNVQAHRRRAKEGKYEETRKETRKRKREREKRVARIKKTKAKA